MGGLRGASRAPQPGGVGLSLAQRVGPRLQFGNAGLGLPGCSQRRLRCLHRPAGHCLSLYGAAGFLRFPRRRNAGALGGVQQRQHARHPPCPRCSLGPLVHIGRSGFEDAQAARGVLAGGPDALQHAQAVYLPLEPFPRVLQVLGFGFHRFALGPQGPDRRLAHIGVFALQQRV